MNQLEGIPKFVLKCPWSLTENLQLQVEVTGSFKQKICLIDCEIKTGRTHQIRVHFRMDIPLLVMKPMATRLAGIRINSKNNPERVMLHAEVLSFLPLKWKGNHFQGSPS